MTLPDTIVEEVSYTKALADTGEQRRHLLLGNGFSIRASREFIFDNLYGYAIRKAPSLALIFNRLGVRKGDFEAALKIAGDADAEALRAGLIRAVKDAHPALTRRQYEVCAGFLADFVAPGRGELRGSIFTTNYDLLLYRALIIGNSMLDCQDGFGDGYWSASRMADAHVFYWHGALHIFRADVRPLPGAQRRGAERYYKVVAAPTTPLMPLLEERLRAGHLPVFVTEATPEAKQEQIGDCDYLRKVRRRFGNLCKLPNTVLFTVGHSLSEVDAHIARKIGASGLQALYFGWFSEIDRQRIEELAAKWSEQRRLASRPPLKVFAFHTDECRIWGPLLDAVA